jgi:HEAT repeat protein
MKELVTSRLTLVLSILALVLAGLALKTTLDERRSVPVQASAGMAVPDRADELSQRDQELAAQIESLRGELDALRSAAWDTRREATTAPVSLAEDRAPPATDSARADDGFSLRNRLLEGFHELDKSDREDALEELAELARWGDEEALALIVRSLTDASGDVRARALRELSQIDRENLDTYLRQCVADTSGKVREVVASRLDELPDSEAGPMLVEMLKDSDEDVVIAAIKSLDEIEYAEARPHLIEQLGDEDLDVVTVTACALAELGDESARGATVERILRDFAQGDVSDRVEDVKRLRRLRARKELAGILESDASLAVREEARDALARLED